MSTIITTNSQGNDTQNQEDLFIAIHNHKIVFVPWHELTHKEQELIYVASFHGLEDIWSNKKS